MPFASTTAMSFVEVSRSTLIMLKVSITQAESAFCSIAGETAASVVNEREHRRHVGADHAAALGDGAHVRRFSADRKLRGDFLSCACPSSESPLAASSE
jgi:Ni,Fe-hydrogenase III component G